MKLLIIEDEVRLRNRLVDGIPWMENEIEIAGWAANGRDAVSIFERIIPDILLLDIQMPEMNGLELSKYVFERYPAIKIIILTGHDEFDFARESIEYGVYKYLLKPCSNENILDAVLSAAAKRREELQAIKSQNILQRKWMDNLPRLQNMFYQNWLSGRYTQWEIEKRSEDLMIRWDTRYYFPVVVDMDPLAEEEHRFTEKDSSLLQFSLYCIAQEYLEKSACKVVQDDYGLTVCLFLSEPDETEKVFHLRVNTSVSGLLGIVKDCLKLTASAGTGICVSDKEHVSLSYSKAKKALQSRIVMGNDIVVPYQEQRNHANKWLKVNDTEKLLEIALETGDYTKASNAMDSFIEQGLEQAKSIVEAREFLFQATGLLTRLIHGQGWVIHDVAGADYSFFENLTALLTKDQMIEWLHRMVRTICKYANEQRKSGMQKTIADILQLIENQIDKDINLYTVADALYLNSSYLSRLFKDGMGMPFSVYVLRKKMERAKELLHMGMKVYDVSEMIGYSNVSYFSKVFQKYWGMKPGDMKK